MTLMSGEFGLCSPDKVHARRDCNPQNSGSGTPSLRMKKRMKAGPIRPSNLRAVSAGAPTCAPTRGSRRLLSPARDHPCDPRGVDRESETGSNHFSAASSASCFKIKDVESFAAPAASPRRRLSPRPSSSRPSRAPWLSPSFLLDPLAILLRLGSRLTHRRLLGLELRLGLGLLLRQLGGGFA